MHKGLRRTFKGRGFYLLGGTLCATVIVVVAACCAISLLTIGRATQQQGSAIDAAITAFDLYQQERSPLNNSVSDLAVRLDSDGTLAKLAADQSDMSLREQVARRLAAFEHTNTGDVEGAYVVLHDERGQVSFILGSASAARDARTIESRLAQLDLDDLMASGRPVTRLSVQGGTAWSVAGMSYLEQASIVVFYQMPEVPNVDVLEPIAEISEMYFADETGSLYPVGSSAYAEAVDVATAAESDDDRGIFSVTHDGRPFREYFHKPGNEGLIFIFIVPDVAQAASRQFALTVVLATALLVGLGCAAGLFLTHRIYEPLQVIIAKLAPDGRDVRDEFKLIGLALDAMENRLAEQDETVAEYHLMRLLRGRASLAQEGAGFFFAEPSSEVALAIVRCDDPGAAKRAKRAAALGDDGKDARRMLPGTGAGPDEVGGITPGRKLAGQAGGAMEAQGAAPSGRGTSPLAGPLQEYLRSRGRACALCEESGFVFVVVDAQGGGIRPLFEGMVEHLRKSGLLVSAFVSNVHAGAAKLSLCYRESVAALESGTRKGAFNKVVRYERAATQTDERKTGGPGARGANASETSNDPGAMGTPDVPQAGRAGGVAVRDGQADQVPGAGANGGQAGRAADSDTSSAGAAQNAGSPAYGKQGASPDNARAPQSGMHASGDSMQAAPPDDAPASRTRRQTAPPNAAQGTARHGASEDLPVGIEDIPLPRGGALNDERNADDLLAYVRQNYRDPALTATLVAERFGMSRAGVSRAFARAVPEGGFLGYLHGLRLDKAEELLAGTQLSVAEVAEAAGYGSALTMSRAFKRYRDTTPGAFRKSRENGPQGVSGGEAEDPGKREP